MQTNLASNPGAVVIDGHGRADLGVVRALGERGVPVYLLTDNRRSPVALSRFVTELLPFPPPAADDAEQVDALVRIGMRFAHKPVFFSTGDSSLILFSRNRERLEPYYRHHLSDPELIEGLYDKVRFARLSRERGLDVPFTLAPRTLAELETDIERFSFPVIVKPAEKLVWARYPEIHSLTNGNIKGVRLDTPEALLQFFRAVSPYDTGMVIQNYIEGRDEAIFEMHAYIDRDGDLVGCFSGQKLRTYPIHEGIGCFQTSVKVPKVVRASLRTLRRLRYRGHAAVQLKRLPGEERFQIFEINCRYSAWNRLHSLAGVNLAYAAYLDCLGNKQQRLPRQREGMRWIDVSNDLRALRHYRRCGEWTVSSWAASYLGRNHYAFFALNDPAPLLVPAARRLGRLSTYPVRWTRRQLIQARIEP